MRRLRIPIGDEPLLAGVVLLAFVVAGLLFGRVVEILNVCTTSRCPVTSTHIDIDIGAGLIAIVTAFVVLAVLRTRNRSS